MAKEWLVRMSCTILVPIALLLVLSNAMAIQGPEADWSTVDGGGGVSTGAGGYLLAGTIGQPDAGLLSGGAYSLAGGLWAGGAQPLEYKIYLPLVMRPPTHQSMGGQSRPHY